MNAISRMLDPIILSYGKGELTAFPADANGVIDLVCFLYYLDFGV